MVSPSWTADLAHSGPTPADLARRTDSAAYSVQVLRGEPAIQAVASEIAELRRRTQQDNNPLLSLAFFLGRVRLFPGNEPVVLLVRAGGRLEAAVYLYEMLFWGMRTGYFRGFDHLSGEGTVIAHQQDRTNVLQLAILQLFAKTPARVAWATVCRGAGDAMQIGQQPQMIQAEVSSTRREHRLKLGKTFADTLEGRFGQDRRRNLRRYRRRAETELGASFNPDLTFAESDQALRELSEHSFQPFDKSLAEWRKMDGLLRTLPGYFAMGLQANQKWISYLVGMRAGKYTYVLLQVNHNGYARYSLSTVLRSYFFEHEIALGQEEIKFVNGVCAAYQRCCEPDQCVTVTARRGLAAFVLFNWIAPWHSAPDHALNMKRWTA